ncbi:caspase recruitment domain-containing protein 8-like isoform X2 [Podarcis muralis]
MQEDAPSNVLAAIAGSVPAVESAGVESGVPSLRTRHATRPRMRAGGPQTEDRNRRRASLPEGRGSSSPVRREESVRAVGRSLSTGGGMLWTRRHQILPVYSRSVNAPETVGGQGAMGEEVCSPSADPLEPVDCVCDGKWDVTSFWKGRRALRRKKHIFSEDALDLEGYLSGTYDSERPRVQLRQIHFPLFGALGFEGYNPYVTNDAYKPADIYGDLNSGRENRFLSGIQVGNCSTLCLEKSLAPEVHPGSSSEKDSGLPMKSFLLSGHHLTYIRAIYGLLACTLESLDESELKKFKGELCHFSIPMGDLQVTQDWLQECGAWTLCHLLLRHYDVDGAVEVAAKVLKAIDCQPQADKLLRGRASIPESSVQVSESPLFAEKGQCRKTSPANSRKSVFCYQCPREDLPERIIPDVVWDSQRNHEIYRLCSLEAGSFQCYYTDLIFEVGAGVTVTYHFDSWHKHLNGRDARRLSVAGPLLNIQADPLEAVAAVHFPHFLCLADGDSSQVYIGHFVEEGMSLEKPSRVGSRHAVLRNPKFSSRGVVFKKPWFKRKMKVHCITLLYQVLEVPAQKFHLYLLPNDSSLRKTVHEKEEKCPSWRLDKPSVILKPLRIGSRFFVQKLDDVEICPKELELQYLHADMEQQYLELYAEHRQDKFHFNLIEKKKDELIWEAFVRQEASPPYPMSVSSKQHFIEQHREELIQRTSNVEAVLDMLLGTILNNEQYEIISSKGTNQEKMRALYMLVPSWNRYCKDLLYKVLKNRNPYLFDELEGK